MNFCVTNEQLLSHSSDASGEKGFWHPRCLRETLFWQLHSFRVGKCQNSSTNYLCFHTTTSKMWKYTCGKCHFKGLYPFKGAALKVNIILGLRIRNGLLGLSCRK